VAVTNRSTDFSSGLIHVYDLSVEESRWVPVGEPVGINDLNEDPSVFLSNNGTLAIGVPKFAHETDLTFGKVQVLEFG